jgi:hypothetical protein
MKTTIQMAREAAGDDWGLFQEYMPEIHRLVELVRADEKARMAEQPAQTLPFGVGGGLVAIKTLLSRDPCVHANTAIQMIDAILAEQPAQRTWVGLTDEEVMERWEEIRDGDWAPDFYAVIEAKLKEKNT